MFPKVVLPSKHLLENLTEDVGLKAVMLNESHIAIAFTADISNQTPANMKASKTWFSFFFFHSKIQGKL